MNKKLNAKLLNLLLVLASLIGYLEWGKENSSFLFQVEAVLISTLFTDPTSVIHPFTLLPLAGQALLIFTLFQNKPSKTLTFVGMAGIGILLVFMFVIGIVSLNYTVFLSTIPFLAIGFLTIRQHIKQ